MPCFADDPIHQHAAEAKKDGAATHKGHGDEKVVASPNLEPSSFRKRNIRRQKHQGKQGGNDDVKDLTGGLRQAFRGLCDQSFARFHGSVFNCKSTKIVLIFKIFFQHFPYQGGLKAPLHGKSGQFPLFLEVIGGFHGLGLGL